MKSTEHVQREWGGEYFGDDGVLKRALFRFASTLYGALGSREGTLSQRIFVLVVFVCVYVALRVYDIHKMTPSELEMLARFSSVLRQRQHAISCGEEVLARDWLVIPRQVTHTTRMLALAGLVRDCELAWSVAKGGQWGARYYAQLRDERKNGVCDPPEQEIRILRALAWFADRNSSRDNSEACGYLREAMALARRLGAHDQIAKIRAEFPYITLD